MSKKVKLEGQAGRPTKYSADVLERICERLSKGEPMAHICRDADMPAVRTVTDWCNADDDISASIARAREDGEDAIAAECLRIADQTPGLSGTTGGVDSGDVQNRKLRIDTRLKLLAKWNPKRWGDKMDLTSGGDKLPAATHVILPNAEAEG